MKNPSIQQLQDALRTWVDPTSTAAQKAAATRLLRLNIEATEAAFQALSYTEEQKVKAALKNALKQ